MEGNLIWCLIEGFLVDVAGEVHGLVKDAGDCYLAGLDTVDEDVLTAAEGAAALDDLVESFASRGEGIFGDALHCGFHQILIGRQLLFAPGFEGV